MRKYPAENWKRLGEWLHDARMESPEYRDVEKFSKAIGRSSRQVRGLERGEQVGVGTLEAYAQGLGISSWYVFARLADPETPGGAHLDPRQVRALKEAYTAETGRSTESVYPLLANITDDELLDEVRRRMTRRARDVRSSVEADELHDTPDPAPMTDLSFSGNDVGFAADMPPGQLDNITAGRPAPAVRRRRSRDDQTGGQVPPGIDG